MNFQSIPKIEKCDFYIDLAFRRAKEKADFERQKSRGTRLEKSRKVELAKLGVVEKQLRGFLTGILKEFPSIDMLPPFYLGLIKAVLDYKKLKKSLGALNWALKTVSIMHRDYAERIRRCRDLDKINAYKQEFFGRISSVMKQIKKNMEYLENSRRTMKGFPVIKEGMPTVAIAGFPNVGKTTLLYKLTGSRPEISNYAFTTKGINVAYAKIGETDVQFLDVPGTLNRPDKMNYIERQAEIALRMLADITIYVFDPSESSYPIESQEKLYKSMKKLKKKMIAFVGKKDISEEENFLEIINRYKGIEDAEEVKKAVSGFFEWIDKKAKLYI